MASLAERLRAQLLMPPPPAKRPSEANDDGGADARPRKRARNVDEEEEARPNVQDVVRVETIENDTLFTPLRTVYKERMREQTLEFMRDVPRSYACLFCEFGDANLMEETHLGSWVVGYSLMVNYIRANWATRAERSVCNEVVRLFRRHLFDPCVAANDGQVPEGLLMLTPEDVSTHMNEHTRHPIITSLFCLDTLKQLVYGLSGRVFVNGVPDVKVATVLMNAVAKLDVMNDKCTKLFEKEADIVLDPLRVRRLANTDKLERLRAMSSDALGGATATGSSASAAASAALDMRPVFGNADDTSDAPTM